MAVHTLQFHGLVIDIEVTAFAMELVVLGFRIPDFHLTNAEVCADTFDDLSLAVQQCGHEHIAVGLFGTPGTCVGDKDL